MTQEEKIYIAKLIRKETGCGMMAASTNFDKLLIALKNHPLTVMDNQPYELKISWEEKPEETPADDPIKYIRADLTELDWVEIAKIDGLLHDVLENEKIHEEEGPASYYIEVLRRFNEWRNKWRNKNENICKD